MTGPPTDFATEDQSVLVWGDEFRGPALLWVVVNRSSLVQSDGDGQVVHFLIDHGADAKVTKEFLNYIESWASDYPAYQDMRKAVFGTP